MLSKFERTRILSARAHQIADCSPIFVKTVSKDPYEIAKEELERGKIPLEVVKKKVSKE